LRLVLDTNVVLDLVVFDDPSSRALRAAIEDRSVTLHADAACLVELRRVLAYPEFALDAAAQDSAYEWYASRVVMADSAPSPPSIPLPRCRDADDQKFLEVALGARADHVITKDRALLELSKRVAKLRRFTVTAPANLDRLLHNSPDPGASGSPVIPRINRL